MVKTNHSVLATILVTTFFLYVSSASTGYFADDVDFVSRAQQGTLWRAALVTIDGTREGSSWRPLTGAIFAVTYALPAYLNHLVSLALYLLLIAFIYVLARTLQFSSTASLVSAALFAWLPAHVEPVVWIAARADILAALLAVGAWCAWAREKRFMALLLFVGSLLAKEVWILLPLAWSIHDYLHDVAKKNIRWWTALAGTVFLWGAARFAITGYTFGGYSISSQTLFERIRAAAEQLVGFFVGAPLVGPLQLYAVGVAREWWLVTSVAIAIMLFYAWWKFRRKCVGHLLAGLVFTIIPALFLVVVFPLGMSSVGEQRYWFAPSVALALIGGFILGSRWHHLIVRLASGALLLFFILGTAVNITLFHRAALYRDDLLVQWQKISPAIITSATVAGLPDTYHGVHLFAERYFLQTLVMRNLSQPAAIIPLFQACARRCTKEQMTAVQNNGRTVFHSPTSRLFLLGTAGMHRTVEIEKNGLNTLFWDGGMWKLIGFDRVEKTIPSRY